MMTPVPDQLRFVILADTATRSERLAWHDEEGEKLEQKLREIAIEVIVSGELQYREGCERQHKWRIEQKARLEEEARRRQAEAEKRERERRIRLEKERVDRLLDQASRCDHLDPSPCHVNTPMNSHVILPSR